MVNDKHILDSQSERRDRGESENINIACEMTAQTDVRGCSEILQWSAIPSRTIVLLNKQTTQYHSPSTIKTSED